MTRAETALQRLSRHAAVVRSRMTRAIEQAPEADQARLIARRNAYVRLVVYETGRLMARIRASNKALSEQRHAAARRERMNAMQRFPMR